MAQVTVYVPDAFLERLNRNRHAINVSVVCRKALLEAMERVEAEKDPAPVWALGAL